jgi:glycosyltransferase involved in cell wall biosynthesis
MRISVVIPTYECQQATIAALRSVLAQQTLPLEVVIVDDHSSVPFTLPPDLELTTSVEILRLDRNRGAAAARNAGVEAASGEWIAFLDSDDTWMPDKLSRQIARIGGEADMRVCYATGFTRVDKFRGNKPEDLIPASAKGIDAFAGGCWFAPGSTAIVHRKAFDIVGAYDTSLRRLEDFDWFLRFGAAGGSLQVAPFAGSLISVADRPTPEKVEEARAVILAKWSGDAGDVLGPRGRARLAAYLDLECASANFYSGNRVRAFSFLAGSFAKVPRLHVPIERWWDVNPSPQPEA